jgi:uncharacterized protein
LGQRCCLPILTVLVSAALSAAETPIPEPPTRWVTDTANFLSPETVRSLDARLAAYQQGAGHQLLVYIGTTTGDAPIEDWAVRAFQKWKVGRKGLDDGLVLFIMSKDRKLRIEVGYGLEAVVPDAIASRIINETITPRIQRGDPNGAVTAGIDALTAAIGGQAAASPATRQPEQGRPQQGRPEQSRPISPLRLIFYGIVGFLILIFVVTHPSVAFFLLANILSGGGRDSQGGGGGFGGGGFSGGGGRSGGGGASGSW